MAHSDSLKLQLPRQSDRPSIECDQLPQSTLFSVTTSAAGSSSASSDHRPYFQTLREMLESNKYQLAIVFRGRSHLVQGTPGEAVLPTTPVVLIPFQWTELVAQIHELIGESNTLLECGVARFGDVRVNLATMEVSRSSGEPILLTIQEFKTLKCFLLNPDRVFSRDELLNKAWGYKNYPSTRTVDNHILRLRQKLESDPGHPAHFLTVHGVGYKFAL